MLESIGPLITAIKNAGPRLYAAALISSLLLLFLPNSILAEIGLLNFRQTHRLELGVTLLASITLLSVHSLFAIAPFVQNQWKSWRWHSEIRKALADLTDAEKVFLRSYIIDGENTRYESIYDGVANGLRSKQIVYLASSITVPGMRGMVIPYNLQPYARKVLNKRRHLLN
jgi:hypothetical protein